MNYKLLKRILDLTSATIGFIVLLPLMVIVWIIIKLESRGSAIFKQTRLGRDGRPFTMYKFRSMVVGAEKGGVYSQKGDSRVTRVGRIIRATSIDELPQLLNVIRGDMSVIGPRPVLTYHPYKWGEYPAIGLERFKVRPGITGWAQVNGRKTVDWDRRFEFDSEYVSKLSLGLDIKILFLTFFKVLASKDNSNKSKTV